MFLKDPRGTCMLFLVSVLVSNNLNLPACCQPRLLQEKQLAAAWPDVPAGPRLPPCCSHGSAAPAPHSFSLILLWILSNVYTSFQPFRTPFKKRYSLGKIFIHTNDPSPTVLSGGSYSYPVRARQMQRHSAEQCGARGGPGNRNGPSDDGNEGRNFSLIFLLKKLKVNMCSYNVTKTLSAVCQ